MATPPEDVRTGLTVVTTAAAAELAASTSGVPLEQVRGVLFEVAPLIVETYSTASASLGADWYEDLREDASPPRPFTPTVIVPDRTDAVQTAVAVATPELRDASLRREIEDVETYVAKVTAEIEAEMQREIADAMRETVTDNTERDPDAVGWKRHARPEACKFCKFLAAKGAVYTKRTARFAAHSEMTNGVKTGGNCMCIAGPAFGGEATWAEATPLQYTASERKRTAAERARLREYLRENFPDAPG